MRDAEPLQTKHPPAPPSEVVGGGAAHPPYAYDDNVVATGVPNVHYLVFPFGDCLTVVLGLAFVSRAGSGTSSESCSSS